MKLQPPQDVSHWPSKPRVDYRPRIIAGELGHVVGHVVVFPDRIKAICAWAAARAEMEQQHGRQ